MPKLQNDLIKMTGREATALVDAIMASGYLAANLPPEHVASVLFAASMAVSVSAFIAEHEASEI